MNLDSYNVIMAGVVPPPVHGASLATRALFDADLSPIRKHLLEIRSSQELKEVGKASWKKVFGLFGMVLLCAKMRITTGAKVLYYTPGSANAVPFVRDVVFLGLCRWMFRRTILHYHSGGLNDFLGRNKWLKRLGSWIYGRGSWAITLSEHVKVPDHEFGACRLIEVPNGLDIEPSKHVKEKSDFLRILFLGNLYEDKGVFDLIRACQGIVDASSVKIHLQLVGKWPDEITEQTFRGLLAQAKENPQLEIPEPRAMYGDEKWAAYAEADLFVFPTYYQSENFPLVLLEAMASGLPVVSTRWRGIPSIVIENETGYLHDPGNLEQLQECIRKFIDAPDLLVGMGKKAKARYQHCFTFDKHKEKIRSLLTEACCAS